jgi:hypothetical protein
VKGARVIVKVLAQPVSWGVELVQLGLDSRERRAFGWFVLPALLHQVIVTVTQKRALVKP